MKALIALLIIAAVFYLGRALLHRFEDVQKHTIEPGRTAPAEPAPPPVSRLAGMSPNLEPALAAAQKQGAAGLRNFLNTYGSSIRDSELPPTRQCACVSSH